MNWLPSQGRSRRVRLLLVFLVLLGAGAWAAKRRFWGVAPLPLPRAGGGPPINAPAELARWPWPGVKVSTPHRGLTRWVKLQRDGTIAELLQFDFAANPGLRWEIYDQDEDDDKPFDNRVDFWDRSSAVMARQLNARLKKAHQGRVVAAWNGAFFGYDRATGSRIAFHVSPVVLKSRVFAPGANHRWTLGVNYKNNVPVWSVLHLPTQEQLARFEWAAGALQCLILNGQPLRLQPFPKAGDAPIPQPVASTPQDAGHIPDFDHMKSSRASLAWDKSGRKLWLLFLKEPDGEAASILGARHGASWPGATDAGGWTVADLQNFWRALPGVWCAMNSDAGGVGQRLLMLPNGAYDWIPPRLVTGVMRQQLKPDLSDAPLGGGPLMTFYVRDANSR